MATIIVSTDFSKSGYNALKYACAFTEKGHNIELLLLNVFTLPASYSGEGVSLASIPESIFESENKLKESFQDIVEDYPGITIRTKEVVGDLIETLEEEIQAENAVLVIMGTPEGYGEMRIWNSDSLTALTSLSVPVLTVPADVTYKPIQNIGLAVILENVNSGYDSMFEATRKLLRYTGAKLHVVSVITGNSVTDIPENENPLGTQMEGFDMAFYRIHEKDIVGSIGNFVTAHAIDLLLVRPRKHGIWYNLFHKSYSKELAKLNLIPVMALRKDWNIE